MSSSVFLVVIVGAVICSIAYAVVRGARPVATGPKPATAWRPTAFADPTPATESPSGAGWQPRTLEHEVSAEPMAPLPPARRARALVLLAIWVVAIGAGSAALLGAVTFLSAHVINRALGA